ncbi:MAG TPA: chemotaxis protein CheW [Anaeromyxobacteraceae bacterium]|nr:chemotaxis protein CheW [Anaeromyxobacteraceae bacterium]
MDDGVRHDQQLVFTVADGDYGIPVLKVKEILQWEEVTPVPGTPPAIAGVTNVRGIPTPVVDLARKFGLGSREVGRRTCILVVEAVLGGAPTVLGLKAEAVQEVLDLAPGDLAEPPSFGGDVRVDFLHGLARHGKRFVLLLDIDRVLAAADAELSAAIAAAEQQEAA